MAFDFTTLCPAWGREATMWEKMAARGVSDPDVVDMGVAEMKFPLAPVIRDAVADQLLYGGCGYPDVSESYLQAVRVWMAERHGWSVEPDWMFQTYGLVAAIGYAMRAMTEPGDSVLVFYPSYGPFPRTVNGNGRRLVKSELRLINGRYEMDFDDVEKKLSDPGVKLLILCNPHNPTGRVWTREELTRLGGLCLKHGVRVISDDIHFDLVYVPHVHTVFASISPELASITITLTAPSKSFNIAGLTISNSFVADPKLRQRFGQVISRDMGHYSNAVGLAACRAAYTNGTAWLDEALDVLKGNCEYLRGFLRERIPQFSVPEQQGTYLCWMDCSGSGLSGEALNDFMLSARFMSQRGTDFGAEYTAFQRVNAACPREYLEKALLRLEKAAAAL